MKVNNELRTYVRERGQLEIAKSVLLVSNVWNAKRLVELTFVDGMLHASVIISASDLEKAIRNATENED
jgi:hypothetical protein